MNKTKIIAWIIVAVIIIGGIWYGVSRKPVEKGVIKIGVILPLTGKMADFGEVNQDIINLAVEELRAKGINIKVIFEDHQCDNKLAVSAVEKLINIDKVKILLASTCSGTVISTATIFDLNKVFLFATVVTSKKISGISPFVFRVWPSDVTQVESIVSFLLKNNITSVGIIQEKTDYTQSLVDALMDRMKNIQFFVESFPSTEADYRTHLTKIKEKNPEVIFLNVQSLIAGDLLAKQMKEFDMFSGKTIVLNDALLKGPDFLNKYKSELEGAVGADFVIEDNPGILKLKENYKQKYNKEITKTNVAAAMYDTVYLVTSLIDYFNDPQKIQDIMKNIRYEGISGIISFDENNDLISTTTLMEVKNGEIVRKE